ncbi:MAG: divalent metal cation transporter, partial [Candidatus Aminicenantes bacterium]|nr:divalent metal cation transporter [Candidatus Aminicenantes bacterium]
GPGFMDAALTLGAGTMTAAMLSGAMFGYRTMWVLWVSMGIGMFMMAAMARFTCRGRVPIIAAQNRYHGRIVGSFLTAIIGNAAVAVIFNYGQVSLGTHLIESLTPIMGFEFPRQINWVLFSAITSAIVLSYGRKGKRGIKFVESFMKISIGVMLLCFGACLVLVGVDWSAFFKGVFIPWLPSGVEGLDLFIASSAAAIGVMDWVFFNYTGLARGWGKKHEPLARFDILMGLFLPFVIVNYLVMSVFAGTLHKLGAHPESAPELARALIPLLGHTWSQVLFYVGFLAIPITTTVGMSLACAIAVHEAFGWKPDVNSWRWRICALLPQIGFLAVFYPRPIWLVIAIGAFLSLTNNVVGWSIYLLFNDKRVLGENRNRSYFWNLGILLQITLINAIAIIYVFNRLGWWIK